MSVVAVDIETTGLNVRKDKLLTVTVLDSSLNFITNPEVQRMILADAQISKVFHNAKFDIAFLRRDGYAINGTIHDTFIMAHLLDERDKNDLKSLAKKYFASGDYELPYRTWIKAHGAANVPSSILVPYTQNDATYTLKLFYLMHQNIEKECYQLYQNEIKMIDTLIPLEAHGMLIDTDYCYEQICKIFDMSAELEEILLAELKINNIRSSTQLCKAIYDNLGLDCVKKTKKMNQSVGVDALMPYSHIPTISKLLRYRRLQKLSGFFDELLDFSEDQIMYPNLNAQGTTTGRFSSSRPNLQNIPKEAEDIKDMSVRKSFLVREGYVNVYIDYSQMEVVCMAHIANEHRLIDALANHQDFHNMTAQDINAEELSRTIIKPQYHNNPRFIAKMFNFAIPYGMGKKGLAEELGISEALCKVYIDNYFDANPAIKNLFATTKKTLYDQGYISSYSGRRFHIPFYDAYKGVCALIQGTCADVMKEAMLRIQQYLVSQAPDGHLLMTIHDEFVIELPLNTDWKQHIKYICDEIILSNRTSFPFTVDTKISMTNWTEKGKIC